MHLNVSYNMLRRPIGTLMLDVTENNFSMLSLTSFSSDKIQLSLTYSPARLLLGMKGAMGLPSSSELDSSITEALFLLAGKSDSFTAYIFLLPTFQNLRPKERNVELFYMYLYSIIIFNLNLNPLTC